MTEDREINLEDQPLEAIIEETPVTAPVVVIQYRSRGLPAFIAVPLVLLVAAGSVTIYHRVASRSLRTRSLPPQPAEAAFVPPLPEIPAALALNSQPIAPGGAGPANSAVSAAPGTPSQTPGEKTASFPQNPLPLDPVPSIPRPPALETPPAPPTPGDVAVKPAASGASEANTSSTRPGPHEGAIAVGFSVPTDPDNPFSDLEIARTTPAQPAPMEPPALVDSEVGNPASIGEPPLPDNSALMKEIAQEAEKKQEELQQRQDLKARARDVVDAESLRRIDEDRTAFRRELAEILKTGGKQAGKQIDDLCNRFGRNYDSTIRGRVTYLLRHSTGRVSRVTRVRQFRAFGVPEPGILDYLANELHHLINTRNGPRHPDDIRVSAARLLLSIKLDQDQTEVSGGLQARSVPRNSGDTPGNR